MAGGPRYNALPTCLQMCLYDRRTRFSERIGVVERAIQINLMNDRLKNRLWNVALRTFWQDLRNDRLTVSTVQGHLLANIHADFFGLPGDEIEPTALNAREQIKTLSFKLGWAEFYDLIEFIANDWAAKEYLRTTALVDKHSCFVKTCNDVLKGEMSAYRFVGFVLAPITNAQEITAVETALSCPDQFAPVSVHISTALARLGDRPTPDSRNSIKESISAMEAACQIITSDPKATLSQVLKRLSIHAALERGFSAIYGYTSDADGIRHALLDESTLDTDDARFFLVSCSAFANYLITKSSADMP